MDDPQRSEKRTTKQPSHHTSSFIFKGTKPNLLKGYLHSNIDWSISHNSQGMEAT
jgi:hypothetical protein